MKGILKGAGLDPSPKRGEGTWDEFLEQHTSSLSQCDFFSTKVLTLKGIREAFVIAFLKVKTRQVILSPATLHPDETWVLAQAGSFAKSAREPGLPVRYVQHDRDTKFTKSFDARLKAAHVKTIKSAYRAPNTNAFVDRFIQSIQQECLDRFLVFSEQHLDHLRREYLAFYHEARPHQSLDDEPIKKPKKPGRPKTNRGNLADEIVPLSEIRCRQRLAGLLKSYSRKAA